MSLAWRLPGLGGHEWTGVDLAPDGRWLAVQVRTPSVGHGRPMVLKCVQSSPVAIGEHALAELAQFVGKSRCTLPLPRGDYQMLVMPEPPVLDGEMETSLRWSLAPLIDYPIDEAVVDWMRIPTGEFDPQREKQVYVIVTHKASVDGHQATFQKAKLSLLAVDVRETALRNIAGLLAGAQEGLGLVTLTEEGVSTTFTYRGELYLDRFMAQPLAEVLEGGAPRQAKFFDRVAQQVHQSLGVIETSFPFITVRRIVVAPAPGPLDLTGQLASRLQVPVERLDLTTAMDMSATPELRTPANQARYLVAVGAALRSMKVAA